jgi:hypothetical protein
MEWSLGSRNFSNVIQVTQRWGGWGSNPRPTDYEKPGPALRTRYLIRSLDELAADTFESDEELEEFLAFTYAERHRDLA